jgi:Domain of unknown function (DUF6438)
MHSHPTRAQKFLNWFFEPALAANLFCTLIGTFLVHISNNDPIFNRHSDDSTYLFLRSAFRIADLLGLRYINPVTNPLAQTAESNHRVLFGMEISILVTTFAVGVGIFFLQRRLFGSLHTSAIVRYAGATALFAMPLCKLAVEFHDSAWYPTRFITGIPHFFLIVLIGEILGACVLLAVNRWRPLSFPIIATLSVLHCAFWIWPLWPRLRTDFGNPKTPSILTFCFPIAVVVWLIALHRARARKFVDVAPPRTTALSRWVSAATATCALILLWVPNYFAAEPTSKNADARVIQLSRGSCFGNCPVYSIRIHADGLVEYSGWSMRHGINQGPQRIFQSKTINPVQLDWVMQVARDAHLARIDQRAFVWCTDAPRVSLTITGDKATQRVTAVDGCSGANLGTQANFLAAAASIDRLVRSDLWICKDPSCC